MEKRIDVRPDDTLESIVYTLLAARARGEQAYCEFNGHKYHSETVTMRQAKDDLWFDEYREEKLARAAREERYAERVQNDRLLNGPKKITLENVVAGLEYIANHQSSSQDELIDGLLERGCNYTWEDWENQYGKKKKKVFPGMRWVYTQTGADVLINMRDNEGGRCYCEERFLSIDDKVSIYHFIRVAKKRIELKNNLKKLWSILGFGN